MAITMCIIFLVIFDIEIYARLSGPLNAATLVGDRVIFNCSTNSSSRLRWSRRFFGASMTDNQQILTRGNIILPNLENEYSIELINNQFNLILLHSTINNAGKYICLELWTSKTASAELTVIESTCNMTADNIHCDAFYMGLYVPDVDFRTHLVNSTGHLSRRMEKNVSCVISFSEYSVKPAEPENENGVIGVVAENSPGFVYTVECDMTLTHMSSTLTHMSSTVTTLSSSTHQLPITSPIEIAPCNSNNILAILVIFPLIIIIIIIIIYVRRKKTKNKKILNPQNGIMLNNRLSTFLPLNCCHFSATGTESYYDTNK